MPQDREIHGLPPALKRDGWWLDADTPPRPHPTASRKRHLSALVLLILLADVLFWGQSAGLSLALFAVATVAATLAAPPRPLAVLVVIAAVLPVADHVQPLSLAILILGTAASIAMTRLTAVTLPATLMSTLALIGTIPWRAARDLRDLAPTLAPGPALRRFGRAWAFPLGGALILVSLLTEANPILDGWLSGLADFPFDPGLWLRRALFWTGMAVVIWPLLVADPDPQRSPALPALSLPGPPLPGLGLNATSVGHALIAFNLILSLQTSLDARFLWTGAPSPPGMTLAEYAHRGAYPLLATALLAGAFALAARPWLAERKWLKPLLILWLGQNILLTLSALYRLDLYVQSFGLTYLRVHAFIWMGLVAAGLALTLIQIAAAKPNLWLLIRCAAMATVTLYLCAFVNFADLIARVNVAEDKIDLRYLCDLGPTAAASIPKGLTGNQIPGGYDLDSRACTFTRPQIHGWRDWGFRNWLVLHNLAAQEGVHEDPRRR